jgi:hypothetical protein
MTTALFTTLAIAVVAADQPVALPGPDQIRRTAQEVLARPEFQVDGSKEAAEGLWGFLHRLWVEFISIFRNFFLWLYQMSPVLAWLFIGVLVITLLLLVGHIAWTIVMVVRGNRHEAALADSLTSQDINPEQLVKQAEAARAEGNFILGVRLLFRACLVLLEQREGRKFRLGATNREHLNRYRQTPLYDWLARFVWVIDSKWYGSEACLPADFAACHEAYERINSLAAERANAQHA